MTRRRKNNDGIYYGNLPSNYLANLGKELVKDRIVNLKKDESKYLAPLDIVNNAGESHLMNEKEMGTILNNIYGETKIK